MKMPDLEKIAGKNVYARMKKAGIADPEKLRLMTEEEIMALAGIGPKTAKKIFNSIGRASSTPILEKKYNRLQMRTKLKNIRGTVIGTLENPKPTIERLEHHRKTAHLLQNFLAAVKNLDNKGSEVRAIPYIPMSTSLDYESLTLGRTPMSTEYIGELRITNKDGESTLLKYRRIDPVNNEIIESTDKINGSILNTTSQIMESINDTYNSFRKRSKAPFIIILDARTIKLEDALNDRYRMDISKQSLTILSDEKKYYEWEALFKYKVNNGVLEDTKLFDQNRLFYTYEEEGTHKPFDEYARTSEHEGFWDELDSSGEDKPYVEFKVSGLKVRYGIIQGMQDINLFGFEQQGYKIAHLLGLTHYDPIEDYEQFKELQKGMPIKIAGRSIPLDLFVMIDTTLNHNFKIWELTHESPIIFQSEDYPDMGFVIY